MLLLIKYTLLYGIVLMLVALGGMFSEHSGKMCIRDRYTPLPDGIRVEMPLQLRTVTVESPLPPDMEGLFS